MGWTGERALQPSAVRIQRLGLRSAMTSAAPRTSLEYSEEVTVVLVQVRWKRQTTEVPMLDVVESGFPEATAGAWAVGKAAREDAMRQPVVHDVDCIVVESVDPEDIADMICCGVTQDDVAWEAAGSHTSSADIAAGMEASSGSSAGDSRAGSLGAASSVQEWAHMSRHAVVAVVAAWASVAHIPCSGSSWEMIQQAGDCPHRVVNISGRHETMAEKVVVFFFIYFASPGP